MKNLCVCLLIITLLSCKSDPVWSTFSEADAEYQETISMELGVRNRILLDSLTSPVSSNFQYIDDEISETLAYWNKNDNSIVYYKLNSNSNPQKQFFHRTGPNTNYSSNFFYLNKDSIFSTDAVQSTYLSNHESQIISTYPVTDADKIGFGSSPYVWAGSPFFIYGNRLFFQTYVGGIFNQPSMAYLDLNSKQLTYFGGYPEFYQRAYWRGGYESMYLTFNNKENIIVQSYAADHFVRIIHMDNLDVIDSAFAGSDRLSNIQAPRLKMSDPGHQLDDRKFLLQPSYGRILYDGYRNLYYRFAYGGINETDIDSDSSERATVKPSRIIILDKAFRKVGEYELPRFKYELKMSFVSKDGLNVKLKNDINEDIIDFQLFTVKQMQ